MPTRSRRPTPELVEKWIKRGYGCGHLGAVGAKDALGMSVPKKARGSMPKQKISDEDIERDVLGARISGL